VLCENAKCAHRKGPPAAKRGEIWFQPSRRLKFGSGFKATAGQDYAAKQQGKEIGMTFTTHDAQCQVLSSTIALSLREIIQRRVEPAEKQSKTD
jgi:hypothetical protein